jgi:hypothetical protein
VRTSALVTRVAVSVEDDHLEKLARPSRRLAGVAELIWNAVDAEADRVSVRVVDNPLQGVDVVEVIDNGHGMARAEALHDFKLLGGSWKRDQRRSKNGQRIVHGSEGEGRWRAFSLGDLVRWVSVTQNEARREKITITGERSLLKEFDVGDAEPTDDEIGTTVTIENIREGMAASLLADDATDVLSAEFALYLEMYPSVEIRYRNLMLDPTGVAKRRQTYEIELDTAFGRPELTVIEWPRDVRRTMLLCDEAGMPLGEIPPGIHAPYFDFTAYLRWAGFREHEPELAVPELHPALQPVIEAAKDYLRAHFKSRGDELEAEVLEEWKQQQVYPYEGEAKTPTERIERDVFDLVAVTASPAVNTNADKVGRRLSLRLLKQALEQNPGSLHRVLQEVLDLSKERLEELERLLERTTLGAIITAARVVADRLDFLNGLDVMLFDPAHKGALLERRQLHRMLAQEPWIFGDEWALAVDDESLTSVLRKHLKLLGREELAPDAEEVLREDDTRGIVDLMLAKSIPMSVQQHEHLVVELKRPSVKVGAEELTQIQRYATAVARDERFAKTNTNWTFWIVSNELDDYAEGMANQADRPAGVVYERKGIRVWAKTWAELLDDCKHRLKFVEAKLELQSTQDDAVDYLRRTYARFLPRTIPGGARGDESDVGRASDAA